MKKKLRKGQQGHIGDQHTKGHDGVKKAGFGDEIAKRETSRDSMEQGKVQMLVEAPGW